jgi:hypothetical protein
VTVPNERYFKNAEDIPFAEGVTLPPPFESQNGLPRSSWTAKDLMGHEFPEQGYAVPGVLAEGLNLLAGAPKLGKSWLALTSRQPLLTAEWR